MDLQYLRRLVKIFDDSSARDLEINEEGIKIKISKGKSEFASMQFPSHIPAQASDSRFSLQDATQTNTSEQKTESDSKPKEAEKPAPNLHYIKSPIVGTFYRAPSPDTSAFVDVGSRVKPGDTLCIVEAMKLMNEIDSDVEGVIEKIEIANASPVEYDQVLFVIKRD